MQSQPLVSRGRIRQGLLAAAAMMSVGGLLPGAASAQSTAPLYVVSQAAGISGGALLTVPTSGSQAFTVTQSIPLAGNPDSIAVAGFGTMAYVRDSSNGTLTAIALTGSQVGTTLGTVTGLGTPSGYAIPATTDEIYIGNEAANTVSVIPTRGPSVNTVTTTIAGFSQPRGLTTWTTLSSNGPSVEFYVANEGANTVSVVSGQTNSITATIPVGAAPRSLLATPTTLFVANSGDNSISVVDRTTNTVTGTITGVNNPSGMFISASASTLYVLESGTNKIALVPLSGTGANTVTSTITVGNGPSQVRVSVDGTQAYILNATDNTISVLSLLSSTVTNTISGLGVVKAEALGGTVTPTVVGAVLPGSRSVQQGTGATVFATLINAGATTASGCRVILPYEQTAPISLLEQETDPSTNEVIGLADVSVTLNPGGIATYLLTFQSTAVTPEATQPLYFSCNGSTPATLIPGVNTVDLAFSATAVPDVIALSATASNNGILTVPFSSNTPGAFAVASANVGVTGALTVVADTNGISLPLSLSLCQTNPSSGQCLATPTGSVSTTIAAGSTPTFSIFATASGSIPLAAGSSRVFLRFLDASGASHGATSVAVQTD